MRSVVNLPKSAPGPFATIGAANLGIDHHNSNHPNIESPFVAKVLNRRPHVQLTSLGIPQTHMHGGFNNHPQNKPMDPNKQSLFVRKNVLSTGDPQEGRGYVGTLPKCGPSLIFSPC